MRIDLDQGVNLAELVDFLVTRKHYLLPELEGRLRAEFGGRQVDGEEFDMLAEVRKQFQAVRILRDNLVDLEAGKLVGGASATAARESVSACTQLISMLTKLQAEIYNISRLQAIEAAVTEVMKNQSEEVYRAFMREMEARLEAIR